VREEPHSFPGSLSDLSVDSDAEGRAVGQRPHNLLVPLAAALALPAARTVVRPTARVAPARAHAVALATEVQSDELEGGASAERMARLRARMRAVHDDEEHGTAQVIVPPWPNMPPNTEAECVEFEDEVVECKLLEDIDGDGEPEIVLPPECVRLIGNADGPFAEVAGVRIPPDSCRGGYYGCGSRLDPEEVLRTGLPARGDNWDLSEHALQLGGSAFRGTTAQVLYPDGAGAAAWADEGGYVYELCCVPTWDVNKHLMGRRLVSDLAVGKDRFGGNLMRGELEYAVAAGVPASHVKRYGRVVLSSGGLPFVPKGAWVENPNFDHELCGKYCLS